MISEFIFPNLPGRYKEPSCIGRNTGASSPPQIRRWRRSETRPPWCTAWPAANRRRSWRPSPDRVRQGDLKDLKVYSLLPMANAAATILSPDLAGLIHPHCWFLTGADRDQVRSGAHIFVPNQFHQIPRLIREFMEVDVTVTTVSPMDRAGFFSFGTVNDYISTAARHCRRLIVEVNRHMPRVFGDALLHVSEVDAIVEHDAPLVELIPGAPKPEAEIIGKHIAAMVPDGATIQLGLGGIPNAVCHYLEGHKDLGIHTELLCPGMVHLIKLGVINGRRKNRHPRKHVFTNALGDRELYEFIHDNPSMESYPVSYTNNPAGHRRQRQHDLH